MTFWDLATFKEKKTFEPTHKVTALAISSDSKLLAMGGG
jgi:hypothetical protein